MPDLTTKIGSIELPSPVMTASGTAGHGAELSAFFDLADIGALVVKSLAHFAWDGNPALRVHATPAGMINSVGLQGPGLAAWIDDELPELRRTGARVVVSIWGRTVDDYKQAAEMLADLGPEVIAVEVNISCPNTEKGNELFAHSTELTETVMAATEGCRRPRWAKLSPNIGPAIADIAGAAAEGGAEAVTLVNTYFGLSVDPVTGRARLGAGRGGVSGPAIRPLAVRAVADVHAAHPALPIIGVGGIADAEHVVEFARVGASAIQVGTATLADPRTCGRLVTDLDRWCANQGLQHFSELIGTATL
ncbi:MAG: dihydroorotate dehydrogenase [Actinomycetota bacterium]